MAVIRSGCFDRQAVADRGAVVLHVEGVLRQPELLGELVDHLRQVVERVRELVVRRHRAVAVAGVVGRDDVVLVRQRRDQVAEHLRAGREAVEQQDRRGVLRPGLAVEDVQVADLHGLVVHGHGLLSRGGGAQPKSQGRGRAQEDGVLEHRCVEHDRAFETGEVGVRNHRMTGLRKRFILQ